MILAPNAFRDCLSAHEVATAMAAGVRAALPEAEVIVIPMADGGDGLLHVLRSALKARLETRTVEDPLRRPITARFALSEDRETALVEMAEASGLHHLNGSERQPLKTTTFGTGQLLAFALDAQPKRLILGVGGSATMDGGAGALQALGARFLDENGRPFSPTPQNLVCLESLDLNGLDPRLKKTEIHVFCDVSTPLEDCVAVFGPQKGARSADHSLFNQALRRLFPPPAFGRPRYGAAGGLAGGMAWFAGAVLQSGAHGVARLLDLESKMEGADLVLTGEGTVDPSSLAGKAPGVVAEMAANSGIPCAVLTGRVLPGGNHSVPVFPIAPQPCDLQTALKHARENLERTASQIALFYKKISSHGAS